MAAPTVRKLPLCALHVAIERRTGNFDIIDNRVAVVCRFQSDFSDERRHIAGGGGHFPAGQQYFAARGGNPCFWRDEGAHPVDLVYIIRQGALGEAFHPVPGIAQFRFRHIEVIQTVDDTDCLCLRQEGEDLGGKIGCIENDPGLFVHQSVDVEAILDRCIVDLVFKVVPDVVNNFSQRRVAFLTQVKNARCQPGGGCRVCECAPGRVDQGADEVRIGDHGSGMTRHDGKGFFGTRKRRVGNTDRVPSGA